MIAAECIVVDLSDALALVRQEATAARVVVESCEQYLARHLDAAADSLALPRLRSIEAEGAGDWLAEHERAVSAAYTCAAVGGV